MRSGDAMRRPPTWWPNTCTYRCGCSSSKSRLDLTKRRRKKEAMEERPRPDPKNPLTSTITRRRLLVNSGIVMGGAMLAGPLAACGAASPTGGTTSSSPKRGGTFRLGVTGGGAKDIIDGQTIVTKPDKARLVAGFETLLEYHEQYKLQPALAESVTQDAPDKWTIK